MSNMKNSATGKANSKNRAKPSFRSTKLGVLPTSIEAMSQLTLDQPTKVALTTAGVKLTVEIDAAGTRVFLADQRTGQMVGGPEDLSKLGGIRAFVTRERKDAVGLEITRIISEIAYRASLKLATEDSGYVQKPLESSYGAAVRPLLQTLERLKFNELKLADNQSTAFRQEILPILTDYFGRIRNGYYAHILLLTKGESKRGQLAQELFDRGVPEFVHTKFTSQAFVLERSQELVRVLFPQDPSKGLVFTVKEWRSTPFMSKQGRWLVRGSTALKALLSNEAFLRAITRIDSTIGLDDETNPSVSKMLKARLYVVPPMFDSSYVTGPGSKLRGGWKFSTPSMDSPAGAMTALGVALLRVYSANLQSVDLVGDYYQSIVPGAVTRSALSPTNNFYVQWEASDVSDDNWIESFTACGTNDDLRVGLWRWLRMELRLSEEGDAGTALAKALDLDDDAKPVHIKRTVTRVPSPVNGKAQSPVAAEVVSLPPKLNLAWDWVNIGVREPIDDIQRPLSAAEIPLAEQFKRTVFPKPKKGKNKVASGANLTRLGSTARDLLEEVERISPPLAARITVWLRGFSEDRLQAAASKLALAQFDELFIADDTHSAIDEDSSVESDGGADV